MATFRASVDLRMVYTPSIAPWVGQSVLICANPQAKDGLPALAGSAIAVPDDLAFAVDYDLRSTGRIAGFEWIEVPDTDALLEQRATAERYAQPGHFDRLDS